MYYSKHWFEKGDPGKQGYWLIDKAIIDLNAIQMEMDALRKENKELKEKLAKYENVK